MEVYRKISGLFLLTVILTLAFLYSSIEITIGSVFVAWTIAATFVLTILFSVYCIIGGKKNVKEDINKNTRDRDLARDALRHL